MTEGVVEEVEVGVGAGAEAGVQGEEGEVQVQEIQQMTKTVEGVMMSLVVTCILSHAGVSQRKRTRLIPSSKMDRRSQVRRRGH